MVHAGTLGTNPQRGGKQVRQAHVPQRCYQQVTPQCMLHAFGSRGHLLMKQQAVVAGSNVTATRAHLGIR